MDGCSAGVFRTDRIWSRSTSRALRRGGWRSFFGPTAAAGRFPRITAGSTPIPARMRGWSPSLYLGVIRFLVGLGAMRLVRGRPRRRWLSWMAILGVLGSFGCYGLGWLAHETLAGHGRRSLANRPAGRSRRRCVLDHDARAGPVTSSFAIRPTAGGGRPGNQPPGREELGPGDHLRAVETPSSRHGDSVSSAWLERWQACSSARSGTDGSPARRPISSSGRSTPPAQATSLYTAFFQTAAICGFAAWLLLVPGKTTIPVHPETALAERRDVRPCGNRPGVGQWLDDHVGAADGPATYRLNADIDSHRRQADLDVEFLAILLLANAAGRGGRLAAGIALPEPSSPRRRVAARRARRTGAVRLPGVLVGGRPTDCSASATSIRPARSPGRGSFTTWYGLPVLDSDRPSELFRQTREVVLPAGQLRDFRREATVETPRTSRTPPTWREADQPATSPAEAPSDSGELCRVVRQEPLVVEIDAVLHRPGPDRAGGTNTGPAGRLQVQTPGQSDRHASILRTNRVMRGAWLPAGRYHLVYRYRPNSFFLGVVASITGWLLLGLGMALLKRVPRASLVVRRPTNRR